MEGFAVKWFLGIDGGGSKTMGCAADGSGRVIGMLEKGPSNHHIIGMEKFHNLIEEMLADMEAIYGLKQQDLEFVCLGLAGMDRPQDRNLIGGTLKELALEGKFLVCNDAEIALAAGNGKLEGVVLIAGTGSIAYGINGKGETFRAGGWGHLVSDEGSGYYIGKEALARGIKAYEGMEQPSVLLGKILLQVGVKDLDELIGFIYSPQTTKAEIAALAKVVTLAAEEGDAVANAILKDAGEKLGCLAKAVIERGFIGETKVKVTCNGSILKQIPVVRTAVIDTLGNRAEVICSEVQPVNGAVRLAIQKSVGAGR
jgi:N-acetylglucosamine kinase-like BadF-type ATPase